MTLSRIAAAALCLAPGLAQAQQERAFWTRFGDWAVTQFVTGALVGLRGVTDLTWAGLEVNAASGQVALTGVVARPLLDWDEDYDCAIRVERIDLDTANSAARGVLRLTLLGVDVGASCLPPHQREPMAALGLGAPAVDFATLTLDYRTGPSAMDLHLLAAVRDAGEIELSAEFAYVGFEPVHMPDAGAPLASLAEFELTYVDAGLFARAAPMIEAAFGDVAALPAAADLALRDALTGGARRARAAEVALISSLTRSLERFVAEPGRIGLSARPDQPIWLSAATVEDLARLVAEAKPRFSVEPLAATRLIAPALVAADPAALGEADRRALGVALLTGRGAPRAVGRGLAVLAPLVEAWDAEAALAVAQAGALTSADAPEGPLAYRAALIAAAGGSAEAAALLSGMEAALPVAAVLEAQAASLGAWPGAAAFDAEIAAAQTAGDVAALRTAALRLTSGLGAPRAYRRAYALAALAAAGGDRGAAAVRDRLDQRIAAAAPHDRRAWAEAVAAAEAEALGAWNDGFAAAVAARWR
jgi:hypothetical protein